eukprot:3941433-Rhodomonas_salina.1
MLGDRLAGSLIRYLSSTQLRVAIALVPATAYGSGHGEIKYTKAHSCHPILPAPRPPCRTIRYFSTGHRIVASGSVPDTKRHTLQTQMQETAFLDVCTGHTIASSTSGTEHRMANA